MTAPALVTTRTTVVETRTVALNDRLSATFCWHSPVKVSASICDSRERFRAIAVGEGPTPEQALEDARRELAELYAKIGEALR